MRITQVNLQRDFGGAEQHTLLLAKGLQAQGHEVTLICHPRGRLIKTAQLCGLPTLAMTARSQMDLRAARMIGSYLRHIRPDLLHLQTSREYLSGAIAARMTGVPLVVISRHMLLPVKPFLRLLFRRLDAIVVLSRAVRENLLRHGIPPAKVPVIYAGIETEEFTRATHEGRGRALRRELGVDHSRLLLGVAGRMVTGKGHRCLLEAATVLAESGMPFTLALAGEGPLRSELEARARQLGIAEKVLFTGFLADIPALMASLDVCVMPSTCAEVMPLVLMEAMAAGCPVVATRVGGVAEIIDENRTGLLVPPGDAHALANALRRLGSEPLLRRTLGESGRAEALSRFTLPRMVAETGQLYQDLLNAKRGASRAGSPR